MSENSCVHAFGYFSAGIQCSVRFPAEPKIHADVEENVNPSRLKHRILRIQIPASAKHSLDLVCRNQLIYSNANFLSIVRVEVLDNGATESIKIILVVPIQSFCPARFVLIIA
jgi:hypothetical protein